MSLIVKAPQKYTDELKLVTDGGCKGNPGPGAIGVVIFDSKNNVIESHSACIGQTTNNRAEYRALIEGLDRCAKYTRRKVVCFMDCELVVKQMTSLYRLKSSALRGLFHKAKQMESPFDEVVYQHVPRKHPLIRQADRLVNEAFQGREV